MHVLDRNSNGTAHQTVNPNREADFNFLYRNDTIPSTMRAATLLVVLSGLLFGALVPGPATHAQASVRSPESIKIALGVLNQVVIDSGRLIGVGSFDRLPQQSDQFESGVAALEQGLGDSPTPLRKQVEPLIARARVAAGAMSEAATSRRTSMLPVAHRQLADAVNALIALFPPDLQPARPL